MPCIQKHSGGCILSLHLVPNARKSGPDGLHGDALKMRIAAPPVDGRANDALIRVLAELTGLPRSSIQLVSGAASRQKRVLLIGMDEKMARAIFCSQPQ